MFLAISRQRVILGIVILVELVLFSSYHQHRWSKGLVPLGRAEVQAGQGLVIRSDGLGYYAWLRSLMVDGDWSFDNEFDQYNPVGDYVPPTDKRTELGLRSNPWAVGPACVWSLGVVPCHIAMTAVGDGHGPWPADGYSMPYQLAVGTVTLMASFLGLLLLYGACRQHADPTPAALAAAFVTLGTTVVYYSTIEVSMGHGLGTVAVAGLAWYWLKTYGSEGWGRWLQVGMLVGAAALMRWQLVTFAVLPTGEAILAGIRRSPSRSWRERVGLAARLGLAALGAVIVLAPQLVAWRTVYGHWLAAPLSPAHNWGDPAWSQVVWAQDRGLFYWTPLALVACLATGVVVLEPALRFAPACAHAGAKRKASGAVTLLLVAFALQVYLMASLLGDEVFLGAAYGFRQLTESVVVLAPGLALLLTQARQRVFRILCVVCCLLVFWNLALVSQYRFGWIPADAGADPASLLTNLARLAQRKPFLLVSQVMLVPAVLAWIGWSRSRDKDFIDRLHCALTHTQDYEREPVGF